MTQTSTQTSPEISKSKHFSLGIYLASDTSRSPQRSSPKAPRTKERSSRGGTRARKSRSPTVTQHTTGRSLTLEKEIACVGMSPSTAECLRAVFAANLWHQGLVHDAMACASFLKFHPNLPKVMETTVLRGDMRNCKTKEEKARQRHSVEIYSSTSVLAGSFASQLPVALEENWNTERKEATINQTLVSGVTENKGSASLTPTLNLLVELWEKMSERCIELIKSEPTISAPNSYQSQAENPVKGKSILKTENKDAREKERKRKSRRGSIRLESNCELCGGLFALPVTAHMRQAHPGCQKPALGLGYNPDGQYCGGWVGNCGEGGIQVYHSIVAYSKPILNLNHFSRFIREARGTYCAKIVAIDISIKNVKWVKPLALKMKKRSV